MINPPLASTAVGVVAPAQSGMASGANSTFRQVGIATGIAALGSILAQQVTADVERGLGGIVPAAALDQLAEALSSGQVRAAAETAAPRPPGPGPRGRPRRQRRRHPGRHRGVRRRPQHRAPHRRRPRLVSAVLAAVLIRQRDFAVRSQRPRSSRTSPGSRTSRQPAPRHADPAAREAPLEGGGHAAGVHAGRAPDDSPDVT